MGPEAGRRVPWEAVIQVAARQIREEGIGGLDLDQTARKLNAAPEAVRYWFPTEADALFSIMQTRQRWFIDQSDTRSGRMPGHVDKLRELIGLCAADYDVAYWIELWKLARHDERARLERRALTRRYRELFARLTRAGQQAGAFSAAMPPDQVALVLVALIAGLSVEVTIEGDADPERMRTILSDACERLLDVDLSGASAT